MPNKSDRKKKCEVCDAEVIDLRTHQRTVHEKVGMPCRYSTCIESFTNYTARLNHEKNNHGLSSRVSCDQCGKIIADKRCLKKHIDNVHKKIRKYECPSCSNRFQSKPHLTNHVKRYHFGLKEHCMKCGSVVQDLRNHIQFVHNNVRNFPCKQCVKRFVTSTDLKKHVNNTHSQFKVCCLICEKIISESSLKSHVNMVHLKNNKNSSCLFCELKFEHKGALRNHIKRSHLQLKEQCPKCGLLSKDLLRHNRNINCTRKGYVVRNQKSKGDNARKHKTFIETLEEETTEIIEDTGVEQVLSNREPMIIHEIESHIPDIATLNDNTPEIIIDVDILEERRIVEKNERLKRWEEMKIKWKEKKQKLGQKNEVQEKEIAEKNVKSFKQKIRNNDDMIGIARRREGRIKNDKDIMQQVGNVFSEKSEAAKIKNEIKEMGEVEKQSKWERWKQKAVMKVSMKMMGRVGTVIAQDMS